MGTVFFFAAAVIRCALRRRLQMQGALHRAMTVTTVHRFGRVEDHFPTIYLFFSDAQAPFRKTRISTRVQQAELTC
jgi:hypothetical protein